MCVSFNQMDWIPHVNNTVKEDDKPLLIKQGKTLSIIKKIIFAIILTLLSIVVVNALCALGGTRRLTVLDGLETVQRVCTFIKTVNDLVWRRMLCSLDGCMISGSIRSDLEGEN